MSTTQPRERQYVKGYQDALEDVATALLNGGEERVLQWLHDNMVRRSETRANLRLLVALREGQGQA